MTSVSELHAGHFVCLQCLPVSMCITAAKSSQKQNAVVLCLFILHDKFNVDLNSPWKEF